MIKHLFPIMGFLILSVLLGVSPLQAQSEEKFDFQAVPWDSVVAEMKIIQEMTATDSLKENLLKSLFKTRNLNDDDYDRFYQHFLNLTLQEQEDFIKSVRDILDKKVKENYKTPSSYGKKLLKPTAPKKK